MANPLMLKDDLEITVGERKSRVANRGKDEMAKPASYNAKE
jgi:hypothetical protein